MSPAYVVDTNVGVVANDLSVAHSPACIAACVEALLRIQASARLAIDSDDLIISEYVRHLSRSGRPGAGDAFMKWVWNDRFNDEHCEGVPIHPRENPKGPDFDEFPMDHDLAKFDHTDRKFAAVAVASQSRPPVMNAVDSHWWQYREALERNGIRVEFVCPEVFRPETGQKRRGRKRK
jgi:hypothetical protein